MAVILKQIAKTFEDLIEANKEAYDVGNQWISNRQRAIREHARKSLEKSKNGGKKRKVNRKKKGGKK